MSTAPHLWRLILEARRNGARLVVVDPFRSRTARVADEHVTPLPGTDAALALGMMRAVVDAGLADEEWCRAHTTGYDALLERLDDYPVERCAEVCGVDAETDRRIGREFATTDPALLRLGVGAQRHKGAPGGVPDDRVPARPDRRVATRGRRLLLHPHRHRGRDLPSAPLMREDLRPGPRAHDQHVAGRRAR